MKILSTLSINTALSLNFRDCLENRDFHQLIVDLIVKINFFEIHSNAMQKNMTQKLS